MRNIGIKMFGLMSFVAGSLSLNSCGDTMSTKEILNEQNMLRTGLSADRFQKMKDSIQDLGAKPYLYDPEARAGIRACAWQDELNKININKTFEAGIETGKQAIRDSLANAAKHIKP